MNATAEEITKQIIFGSVTVAVAALPFVGMLFGAIALQKCKQRCTRGYKRYKETSGLIEWKECQIFHSIFT